MGRCGDLRPGRALRAQSPAAYARRASLIASTIILSCVAVFVMHLIMCCGVCHADASPARAAPRQAYICAATYSALFSITAFDYNKLVKRATIGSALMQVRLAAS
jgi:hypothetical protein